MSTLPKQFVTSEEYLRLERQSPTKHEYCQGEIFGMTGASLAHHKIVRNLLVTIDPQLENGTCEVYPSDLRVKVPSTGLYTYPDAIIVCGQEQFEDRELDTLLNPAVLFEVLSDSTEQYDLSTKARHYRNIESLKQMVFIAQKEARIEFYTRQPDGDWLLSEVNGIHQTMTLSSMAVTLPLASVYRGVQFPPQFRSIAGADDA